MVKRMSGNHEGIIIRDHERDNLRIGWDEEDGFVLLFTPDMTNTNTHYHVELTEDEAVQLSLFLNKKLRELGMKRGN
jgi:hypothetical protein